MIALKGLFSFKKTTNNLIVMEKTCFVSIDVEKDLEKDSFNGVENLDKISVFLKSMGYQPRFLF